jgi:hypothetical protein
MSPSWVLAVRTTLTDALDLTFSNQGSLAQQLALFEKHGLSDPHRLHEFHNDAGVSIAFISKVYLSHHVEPPLQPA